VPSPSGRRGVEEQKFDGGIESLVVCHRKIKKRERERNDGGQREGQKENLALDKYKSLNAVA